MRGSKSTAHLGALALLCALSSAACVEDGEDGELVEDDELVDGSEVDPESLAPPDIGADDGEIDKGAMVKIGLLPVNPNTSLTKDFKCDRIALWFAPGRGNQGTIWASCYRSGVSKVHFDIALSYHPMSIPGGGESRNERSERDHIPAGTSAANRRNREGTGVPATIGAPFVATPSQHSPIPQSFQVIPAGIEPAAYGLGNHSDELRHESPRASSQVPPVVDEDPRAPTRIDVPRIEYGDAIFSDPILSALLAVQASWLAGHDRADLRRRLLALLVAIET